MGSERCCKNCDECVIRHAGSNVVYYECKIDTCIVEPNDRACDKFSEIKKNEK